MKTLHLLACLLVGLLFSVSANAQSTYWFYYDESGNRTNRTVIPLKSAAIQPDSIEAKQAAIPLEEKIGLHKIRIYPNPTKGSLRVELPELIQQEAKITIHDSNGRLIVNKTVMETNNELNLSSYPSGIYIMSIQIGQGNRKEWKIIKE